MKYLLVHKSFSKSDNSKVSEWENIFNTFEEVIDFLKWINKEFKNHKCYTYTYFISEIGDDE